LLTVNKTRDGDSEDKNLKARERPFFPRGLVCDSFAIVKEIRTAPKTLVGYERLAQRPNRLVDVHDELLQQLPFPLVEVAETGLSNAASKALIEEMERIDALLY
jgi:hypothetical protein